ncbi:MAG: M48 family metallopeptidase, partial [Candidatus Omnitrophica bacterium]|nr:M48 family metallopeptidase [Candidatus Omnitrophota bacterium]
MNIYLIIILTILIGECIIFTLVEILNLYHNKRIQLPEEFKGFYDLNKYKISQEYLREKTVLMLIENVFFTSMIIVFILARGFNFIDNVVRRYVDIEIFRGLIFLGILVFIYQLLNVPFLAYHTFFIESKYGFNRTTLRTFFLDILKSLFLIVLIGGTIFSLVFLIFDRMGRWGWLYSWIIVTVFQLFLIFIAPAVILPMFNKFTPLEEGKLKEAIKNYAQSQSFGIKEIFKIDASKRTTKSNAFFTGFGKYRRIALFDNLIEKHSIDELVSILAHEIGHYKKKHILKNMTLSMFITGLMFFLLSYFINNKDLFLAFKMERVSIYASILFFFFLYKPIYALFSVIENFFSRRYELQADNYAVSTYNKPEEYILALKKLTVDNFSNLTPHEAKVFLHYSHPPILKRIEA